MNHALTFIFIGLCVSMGLLILTIFGLPSIEIAYYGVESNGDTFSGKAYLR